MDDAISGRIDDVHGATPVANQRSGSKLVVDEVQSPKPIGNVAVYLGAELRSGKASQTILDGGSDLHVVESLEDLERHLSDNPDALGIIAIEDLVTCLAFRLISEEHPADSVANLESDFGKMASLQTNFHSRVSTIIGGKTAALDPKVQDSTVKRAADRIAFLFSEAAEPFVRQIKNPVDRSMRLLSEYLLRDGSVDVPPLYENFASRALSLTSVGGNMEDAASLELAAVKEENILVVLNLRAADEEILRLKDQSVQDFDKLEALRKGRTARQAKIVSLEQEVQAQNQKIVALRRGREARRETIKNLQSVVSHFEANMVSANKLADDLRSRLEAAQNEILAMQASSGWKDFLPIRRLRGKQK